VVGIQSKIYQWRINRALTHLKGVCGKDGSLSSNVKEIIEALTKSLNCRQDSDNLRIRYNAIRAVIEHCRQANDNSLEMVLCFFSKIAQEITRMVPLIHNPVIFLGKRCNIIKVPINGDDRNIIMVEYLKKHDIRRCDGLLHEIGHLITYKFCRDNLNLFNKGISDSLKPLIRRYRISERKRKAKHIDAAMNWFGELSADRIATSFLGPIYPYLWYKETHNKYTWSRGASSHPPEGLRWQMMKEWTLETKEWEKLDSPILDEIKSHNPKNEYSMFRRLGKGLSPKIMFNNEFLSGLNRLTQEVIDWASIQPSHIQLIDAKDKTQRNELPESYIGLFAFLLEQEEYISPALDLLRNEIS
jgi:hypothetical protein